MCTSSTMEAYSMLCGVGSTMSTTTQTISSIIPNTIRNTPLHDVRKHGGDADHGCHDTMMQRACTHHH